MTSQGKLTYIVSNFLGGLGGYACRMRTTHWHSNTLEHGAGSPGRKYLNGFLREELPRIVPLGRIEVLDIGCGSGYIQRLLADTGYQGVYTGVDIEEHADFGKNESHALKKNFVRSRIEEFETVGKFDLILSNTALEHVENDALAISKCSAMLKRGGVQIHIVPAFWSLFLYLWHGFRQYSPRRIKTLFAHTNYAVCRLGGLFSFVLHLSFITIPVFLLKTDKLRDLGIYPKLVEICNVLDRLAPVCSCLYVVVARNGSNK